MSYAARRSCSVNLRWTGGLAGTIVDFRNLAHSQFDRSLLREVAVCSRDIFPWSARTHVPVETESVPILHQPHGRGGRTVSSDHGVRVSKLQSSRHTPSRHAKPLFCYSLAPDCA